MAMAIVMQGIRIRLGRSVVTIMGVGLGIAFLMATVVGQTLKQRVRDEDRLRADVARMGRLLTAETGPLRGRTLAVMLTGTLTAHETYLLRHLAADGVGGLQLDDSVAPPAGLERLPWRLVPRAVFGDDASAVMVLGGPPPADMSWSGVFQDTRQNVLALARLTRVERMPNVNIVQLARMPRPEELERERLQQRQQRTRNIWIMIIALLVTVMGISNAMLMSVTERFRDIGTMKCLGALSAFVRRLFLIESAFVGVVGGIAGGILGALVAFIAYLATYGAPMTLAAVGGAWPAIAGALGAALATGVILSVCAGIYPASVAARMVPADALRSTV